MSRRYLLFLVPALHPLPLSLLLRQMLMGAGIGVHMTDEQIDAIIQEAVEQNKMSIQSQR